MFTWKNFIVDSWTFLIFPLIEIKKLILYHLNSMIFGHNFAYIKNRIKASITMVLWSFAIVSCQK